jgi:undecaprenyl-diphosphatase
MVPLLARLDSHDRALYQWLLLAQNARLRSRLLWTGLTHCGGATLTILLVLVPLFVARGAWHDGAVLAAWTLLVSHLLVQVAKRHTTRPRPAVREGLHWHVAAPDEFSFPSGHSCAAMAVAFAYSLAVPTVAMPLLVLAVLVGFSRVRLGVHYPGDVIAGQALAIFTGLLVLACR